MFVCLGFNAAFNNLSVISRRNREDDFGYSHMLQNTSHGSKTAPPAEAQELLGIQEYGPPYPGGGRCCSTFCALCNGLLPKSAIQNVVKFLEVISDEETDTERVSVYKNWFKFQFHRCTKPYSGLSRHN